jgi:hypothetical protein
MVTSSDKFKAVIYEKLFKAIQHYEIDGANWIQLAQDRIQ